MKAEKRAQDGISPLTKMYVLDTDVIVDFLRDEKIIKKLIYDLYAKKLYTTFITMSELYFGAYNSKYKTAHFEEINFLEGLVDILYPDLIACKLFGRIKKQLRDTGKIIGDFDVMIAAVTIANNFTLITRNLKHYENIEGLKTTHL